MIKAGRWLLVARPTNALGAMRNVKRWRDESMMRRWVALGITEAQRGFRRVKGFRHMLVLVAALRPNAKLEVTKKVA